MNRKYKTEQTIAAATDCPSGVIAAFITCIASCSDILPPARFCSKLLWREIAYSQVFVKAPGP